MTKTARLLDSFTVGRSCGKCYCPRLAGSTPANVKKPEWVNVLRVVPVEFDGPNLSAN